MVIGALPSTFAAGPNGVVHMAPHNDVMAKEVRFAALETELLRTRDRLGKKYHYVSPRVQTLQSPHRAESPHNLDPSLPVLEQPLGEETTSRLVMPQKQHIGQFVCKGEESRLYEKDQSQQTNLSAWDRLNVPKRVLESHDIFLLTAGRVKPYMTITKSPRSGATKKEGEEGSEGKESPPRANATMSSPRGNSPHDTSRDREMMRELASKSNPWVKGVRRGLSGLKDSSSVEVVLTSVANDHRVLSPRKL